MPTSASAKAQLRSVAIRSNECKGQLGTIDPNTVFNCEGEGDLPKAGEKCAEDQFCDQQPDPVGGSCKPLCSCTGTETKCSQDYNPTCKLTPGIYKCGDKGVPEKVSDCTTPEACANSATPRKDPGVSQKNASAPMMLLTVVYISQSPASLTTTPCTSARTARRPLSRNRARMVPFAPLMLWPVLLPSGRLLTTSVSINVPARKRMFL